MTASTQELFDRCLQLPPAERETFANLLLDSVDAPAADVATQEEWQRRWDRYKSGEDQAMPIDEYLAELDRRIAAGKRIG